MVLERGYLTVAFAVTALTTAIVADRHRIPLLRAVVAALGFIVLGRLIWDPRIMGAAVGTFPVFNWLLLGYGIPAIAFLAAGFVLKRERDDLAARICDALGVLFAALLVFYEIRHALNGGDPLANTSGHVEQGLFALMSLGFAYVLMRLDLGRANPVFRFASLAFGVLSAVFIVLRSRHHREPAAQQRAASSARPSSARCCWPTSCRAWPPCCWPAPARGVRPDWYVIGRRRARHAAVVRLRHAGGAPSLPGRRHRASGSPPASPRSGPTPPPGWRSVWCSSPTASCAARREPRLASAALVFLSVIKVFLYDLTGTGGLWRALSVICLGAVLIGIGLAYQKLIFARPPAAPPSS